MEQFGQKEPDRTILILPLTSANSPIRQSADSAEKEITLNDRHIQILNSMEFDREYSSAEVGELVGLKSSRSRQILKELVDNGKLTSTGSTKGKRYKKVKTT